jgi:hypothetical protein
MICIFANKKKEYAKRTWIDTRADADYNSGI